MKLSRRYVYGAVVILAYLYLVLSARWTLFTMAGSSVFGQEVIDENERDVSKLPRELMFDDVYNNTLYITANNTDSGEFVPETELDLALVDNIYMYQPKKKKRRKGVFRVSPVRRNSRSPGRGQLNLRRILTGFLGP